MVACLGQVPVQLFVRMAIRRRFFMYIGLLYYLHKVQSPPRSLTEDPGTKLLGSRCPAGSGVSRCTAWG